MRHFHPERGVVVWCSGAAASSSFRRKGSAVRYERPLLKGQGYGDAPLHPQPPPPYTPRPYPPRQQSSVDGTQPPIYPYPYPHPHSFPVASDDTGASPSASHPSHPTWRGGTTDEGAKRVHESAAAAWRDDKSAAHPSPANALFREAFPNSLGAAAARRPDRRHAAKDAEASKADNLRKVRHFFPRALTQAVATGNTHAERNSFSPRAFDIQGKARRRRNPKAWLGVRDSFDSIASAVLPPGVSAATLDKLKLVGTRAAAASPPSAPSASGRDGAEGMPVSPEKHHEAETTRLSPTARADLTRYHEVYDMWVEKNKEIVATRAGLDATQRELQYLVDKQKAMSREILEEVLSWTWWVMMPLMALLMLSVMRDMWVYSRQMEEMEFVNYDEVLKEVRRNKSASDAEREKRAKLAALKAKLVPHGEDKKRKGGGGGSSGGAAGGGSHPPPRDIKID